MKNGNFLFGILTGAVLAIALGLFALPFVGIFDITATGKQNILNWWGHTNLESVLEKRAPKSQLPASADLAEGFEHYRVTCLHCHGAPTVQRETWAHDMLPTPPELWQPEVQGAPDGELFYIVNNGIRMSGMPAFGPNHQEKDIWNMVAIIRQLNKLTDQQVRELQHVAELYRHDHHEQAEAEQHAD